MAPLGNFISYISFIHNLPKNIHVIKSTGNKQVKKINKVNSLETLD